MIAKQNRTRKTEKKSENRTLPTFEEFLEFILVSSMEGEIRFLTSINDVMASRGVGQRLCDDSNIELIQKRRDSWGRGQKLSKFAYQLYPKVTLSHKTMVF